VAGRAGIPRLTEGAISSCELAEVPITVRAFVAICDGLELWPQDVLGHVLLHAPRPVGDRDALSNISADDLLSGNLPVDDFVALCDARRLDPGEGIAHMALFVKASLVIE
jgi:hypothetical protein